MVATSVTRPSCKRRTRYRGADGAGPQGLEVARHLQSCSVEAMMHPRSRWLPYCAVAMLGAGLVGTARGDTAGAADESAARCDVRELEYALSARIRLSDTPYGAGDGVYQIGPGRLALRLTAVPMSPETYRVELIDYQMRSRFEVRSKVLFWGARVMTQAESRVAPGVAARGTLTGRKLAWTSAVGGHRTDGKINCNGSGCGMSGAPPEGESEIHIGPESVKFAPFTFARDDLDTFAMEYSYLTHTKQPRQTTHLALGGRKVKERCAEPPAESAAAEPHARSNNK